jgi:hypothetical protein
MGGTVCETNETITLKPHDPKCSVSNDAGSKPKRRYLQDDLAARARIKEMILQDPSPCYSDIAREIGSSRITIIK